MPEIHVPERIKPIISRILKLGSTDYQQLQEALESVEPALNIESLVVRVSKALPNTIKGVGEIVRALESMTHVRLRADRTIDQFVQDIVTSLETEASKFNTQKFFDRVSGLLRARGLVVSARANDLQHDFDRVFISAKVVSDLRTVFDQAGKQIQGSIVVHNLNITYAQEGELKNFFVAMDRTDISKLRTVLDRADAKEEVLKGLLEGLGSPFFETEV